MLKLVLKGTDGLVHEVVVTPEMVNEARACLMVDLRRVLGFEVDVKPDLFACLKDSLKCQIASMPFKEMQAYMKALGLTWNDLLAMRN